MTVKNDSGVISPWCFGYEERKEEVEDKNREKLHFVGILDERQAQEVQPKLCPELKVKETSS